MNELELFEFNEKWFWEEKNSINRIEGKELVHEEMFYASKSANIPNSNIEVYVDELTELRTSGFITYGLKKPELWAMGIDGDETTIAIPIELGQKIAAQLKDWFHCVPNHFRYKETFEATRQLRYEKYGF